MLKIALSPDSQPRLYKAVSFIGSLMFVLGALLGQSRGMPVLGVLLLGAAMMLICMLSHAYGYGEYSPKAAWRVFIIWAISLAGALVLHFHL